jgi:hypothetical protein
MDGFIQAAAMPLDRGQLAHAISRAIAAFKPAIIGGPIPRPAISGRRRVRPGETNKKAARRRCAGCGPGAFYQCNLLLR